MGWFRPRLGLGARLALLTLALNLALSFGHHHFGEGAAHQLAAAENSPDVEHTGSEDQDHQDRSAADPCFTCIVATTAAIAASPPALPAPARMASIDVAAIASFEPRASVRTVFEARAPPQS